MIYTIVSLADVFAQEEPQQVTTEYRGNTVCEYISYNGEKRLRRLFSTDPADFLHLT